jgi:5-(carboxyamino)imidazole ribonucleotide mutase/phosphoribosylaminoimidazole-succinocarboxamide synthase
MPSGIAAAVVLDPANAALLAAKIFGLANPEVREQVRASQTRSAQRILEDDASVR